MLVSCLCWSSNKQVTQCGTVTCLAEVLDLNGFSADTWPVCPTCYRNAKNKCQVAGNDSGAAGYDPSIMTTLIRCSLSGDRTVYDIYFCGLAGRTSTGTITRWWDLKIEVWGYYNLVRDGNLGKDVCHVLGPGKIFGWWGGGVRIW